MFFYKPPKFLIHFNDGAFVEQISGKGKFTVRFIRNNTVEFEDTLAKQCWLKSNLKYYVPWKIEILDKKNNCILQHEFDIAHKQIRINIDSKCLGDTLAWLPQIEQFALQHPDTLIYVSQFLTGFGFRRQYPGLRFIDPDEQTTDVYATYCLGFYFKNSTNHHPIDPRTISLGQVAADVLGIKYRERRPRPLVKDRRRKRNRAYVCIATQSTAGCKLWQYENGWQTIVDYLNSKGLISVVIQKEPCNLKNVIDQTGELPFQDRMTELLHCEFFIGLGSGLSWLAWALEKKVILISGFSLPVSEFNLDCYRIINTRVCHGCWNSTQSEFDRDDWNWCPTHKDTPRQFECTKAIKPQQITKAIDNLIRLKHNEPTIV